MTNTTIDEFWQAFVTHKDVLADANVRREESGMVVLQALRRVDPRLHYHLGYRDGGVDLLLSAEGHLDLSDTLVECIARAPSCAGWRFRPILDSESFCGKRNPALYPDDENGDVLFDIATHAGDLITPQEVEFCHIFPPEAAARSFASELCENDAAVIEPYSGVKGFHWEVRVTRRMIPSHHNITTHEADLAALASHFKGRSDGWGFLQSDYLQAGVSARDVTSKRHKPWWRLW